jgi:hypothetical protein
MRKITVTEEEYTALKFALEDVAESYSEYKNPGTDADEGEQEYEDKVRAHGKALVGLYAREF